MATSKTVKENILKSFGIDIEKGKKTGYYTDTSANRKAGRVGQKYTKDATKRPPDPKGSSVNVTDQFKKKEDGNFRTEQNKDASWRKPLSKEEKQYFQDNKKEMLAFIEDDPLYDIHEAIKDHKKKSGKKDEVSARESKENLAKKRQPKLSKEDRLSSNPAEEGSMDVKVNMKLDNKLDSMLDKYPNDAKSWQDADDGIRDLAYKVRQAYNELTLDVVEGDKGYVEGLNFREFKTPSAWNKGAKKQINNLWGKMNSWAKTGALK